MLIIVIILSLFSLTCCVPSTGTLNLDGSSIENIEELSPSDTASDNQLMDTPPIAGPSEGDGVEASPIPQCPSNIPIEECDPWQREIPLSISQSTLCTYHQELPQTWIQTEIKTTEPVTVESYVDLGVYVSGMNINNTLADLGLVVEPADIMPERRGHQLAVSEDGSVQFLVRSQEKANDYKIRVGGTIDGIRIRAMGQLSIEDPCPHLSAVLQEAMAENGGEIVLRRVDEDTEPNDNEEGAESAPTIYLQKIEPYEAVLYNPNHSQVTKPSKGATSDSSEKQPTKSMSH